MLGDLALGEQIRGDLAAYNAAPSITDPGELGDRKARELGSYPCPRRTGAWRPRTPSKIGTNEHGDFVALEHGTQKLEGTRSPRVWSQAKERGDATAA